MGSWGATDANEAKPKYLTTVEKRDVYATTKGWVKPAGGNDNAAADPEVPDIVFDVEYQWATTFRVVTFLDHATTGEPLPISDTGVIWIYGRKGTSNIIKDIAKDANRQTPIKKSIQGELGDGIVAAMKDGYWITGDDLDKELYFDALHDYSGLDSSAVNTRQYAVSTNPDVDDNPRLGGMSISKDGVYQNMSPSGR